MNIVRRIYNKRGYAFFELSVDLLSVLIYFYNVFVGAEVSIILNYAVVSILIFEYVFSFIGERKKVDYVLNQYSLINITAIISQFFPLVNLAFLRAFRFVKLIKLLDGEKKFIKKNSHLIFTLLEYIILAILCFGFFFVIKGIIGGEFFVSFFEMIPQSVAMIPIFIPTVYVSIIAVNIIGIIMILKIVRELVDNETLSIRCLYCRRIIDRKK